MRSVTVYTDEICTLCHSVENLLNVREIPYEKVMITPGSDEHEQLVDRSGLQDAAAGLHRLAAARRLPGDARRRPGGHARRPARRLTPKAPDGPLHFLKSCATSSSTRPSPARSARGVKMFLRSRGVEFREINLAGDRRRASPRSPSGPGLMTLPQVTVGGILVGGYEETVGLPVGPARRSARGLAAPQRSAARAASRPRLAGLAGVRAAPRGDELAHRRRRRRCTARPRGGGRGTRSERRR